MFRREGEYWTITYAADSFRLKDTKGLNYIAYLLRAPEQEFHALDLVAHAHGQDEARPRARVDGDELDVRGLGDAGPILDARAKNDYRVRLAELSSGLAEAEAFGDVGRIGRPRDEREHLTEQLAAAVGLGGRDRRAAAAAERARVNVTRAISDSVKRVRAFSPPLARHLEASIRTGAFCAYKPPDATSIPWQT